MYNKTKLAVMLYQSYLHRASADNHCVICGATGTPLAFHVLEKSYYDGANPAAGFVAMSGNSGRLRGSFPVCNRCSPPCRKCKLPVPVERVFELGITELGAHCGCGVCEHIHLGFFFNVLRKRLFGLGRFKRH